MAASSVARRTKKADPSEADAWLAGAREQFDALIELARTAEPDAATERDVMKRLAVVGAALLQSLSARRATTPARRPRSRRRTRSA
jgi:hypothetical protein